MENLALIRVPSVNFASENIRGHTIYRGIDDFTLGLAERLRHRVATSEVLCGTVRMRVNPVGSCFDVSSTRARLLVSVCLREKSLPTAEAAAWVAPRLGFWAALLRRRAVPHDCLLWFHTLFRRAVELEFQGCGLAWTTFDDYIHGNASD